MANHYSFKLRHPTLDLSTIAQKIPLDLARIWRFDDSRFTPDGEALPGKYKDSYCIFKLPKEIGSLQEVVHFIQAFMVADPALMQGLTFPYLEKSIYCSIDGDGETLAVPELKILCDLDINLEID